MKTIGFPTSTKENEKRRVLLPPDVKKLSHPEYAYFETGYGDVLGYADDDYIAVGAKICPREETFVKDIVCDPKIGDANYLDLLPEGTIAFGWLHAVRNRPVADALIRNKLTAYAWEDMYESGRHVFWRNNELAGEAAVTHAFLCFGRMPYETKVAVLGNGNTARGAIKVLNMFGAEVRQYGRSTEDLFRRELGEYDVVVNCVLWDTARTDHIIYREDLRRMKRKAMIIDVSCDEAGAIETSVPTAIRKPVYETDGVLHYVVDHTPALYYKTFSQDNSETVAPYIDMLINDAPNSVLKNALIIKDGEIIDERIKEFQHR